MFRSIQYKLYLFIAGLVLSTAVLTYFIINKEYVWIGVCCLLIFFCIIGYKNSYEKYNQNILFLLNALDNGDYSFHFSETKISARERELNVMMNQIKEILTNARKEVIENEKYLSLILESVSTGIIIADERGIVHDLNKPALSLLGIFTLTHLNQLKFINDSFPQRFFQLKAGDHIQIEISNEREEQQISVRASEMIVKERKMKILTLNNIGSELEGKEMESWIRLIRVMTHEIMNSIAPINSLSDTLLQMLRDENAQMREEELKENTLEAIETIHTTAGGLLNFVESYRKFTAIPQPKKKKVRIKELIDKNVRLFDVQLKEKGISLTTSIASDDPFIEADENLINQVVVNLIKNAIEAVESENGKIFIPVYRTPNNKIRIDVINNGEKIPAELLAHIFVPFFTTKPEGSGIGLSVSRYIMRLHGGKLIHSVTNKGETTFSLEF